MIHPIMHPTHLLAAITVGLLAAVSGGTARWAYPASSFGAVMLGAVIGYSSHSPTPLWLRWGSPLALPFCRSLRALRWSASAPPSPLGSPAWL